MVVARCFLFSFGIGVGGGDIAVVSSGRGSGWDRFRVGSVVQFRVCSSPG